MSKAFVRCPAKINLHLQVIGRRGDGYHELRTIFQAVDLCDDLEVELTEDSAVRLEVTGEASSSLSSGPENLVHRAARAALEQWGTAEVGVRLRLHKRIPTGAGLGGGSSDAAATLLVLRSLLGAREGHEIWLMARALGADVPFFLIGGTALGVGRGDEVVALPDLPSRRIGLALPGVQISSAGVFSELKLDQGAPLAPPILHSLRGPSWGWESLSESRNELQEPVFSRYPELARVLEALSASGATQVRLTGSGSALFALYPANRCPDRVDGLPEGCQYMAVDSLARGSMVPSVSMGERNERPS